MLGTESSKTGLVGGDCLENKLSPEATPSYTHLTISISKR